MDSEVLPSPPTALVTSTVRRLLTRAEWRNTVRVVSIASFRTDSHCASVTPPAYVVGRCGRVPINRRPTCVASCGPVTRCARNSQKPSSKNIRPNPPAAATAAIFMRRAASLGRVMTASSSIMYAAIGADISDSSLTFRVCSSCIRNVLASKPGLCRPALVVAFCNLSDCTFRSSMSVCLAFSSNWSREISSWTLRRSSVSFSWKPAATTDLSSFRSVSSRESVASIWFFRATIVGLSGPRPISFCSYPAASSSRMPLRRLAFALRANTCSNSAAVSSTGVFSRRRTIRFSSARYFSKSPRTFCKSLPKRPMSALISSCRWAITSGVLPEKFPPVPVAVASTSPFKSFFAAASMSFNLAKYTSRFSNDSFRRRAK